MTEYKYFDSYESKASNAQQVFFECPICKKEFYAKGSRFEIMKLFDYEVFCEECTKKKDEECL